MFNISESDVEILSEVGGTMSQSVKLHTEMRLSLTDYKDEDSNGISYLYDAAQAIPQIVHSNIFPKMFLSQLNSVSVKRDKVNYKRFGWLKPDDIEVRYYHTNITKVGAIKIMTIFVFLLQLILPMLLL